MNVSLGAYSSFLSVCGQVANFCSDIQIVNGRMIQKSDNSLYLIEADFNKTIPDFDLRDIRLTSASSKLQMMATLVGDNEYVAIEEHDDYYVFSDGTSILKLRVAPIDVLTNKYSEDSLPAVDDTKKLFEFPIDNVLIKKIKRTTSQTMAPVIDLNFKFDDYEGCLVDASITSTDKNVQMRLFETSYSNLLKIPMKTKINWDCFLVNGESTTFSFYTVEDFVGVSKTTIKSKDGCELSFYQRIRMKDGGLE